MIHPVIHAVHEWKDDDDGPTSLGTEITAAVRQPPRLLACSSRRSL